MDVRGQLHVAAALTTTTTTGWIEGWVVSTAGPDVLRKNWSVDSVGIRTQIEKN